MNTQPMEDADDLGLKAVMGAKFKDETKPRPPSEAPDALWEKCDEEGPGAFHRLLACGKFALLTCLGVGVFRHWYETGQMDPAAAMSCMVALAGWGGYRIGSLQNYRERNVQ